jgi:hypothetical protein
MRSDSLKLRPSKPHLMKCFGVWVCCTYRNFPMGSEWGISGLSALDAFNKWAAIEKRPLNIGVKTTTAELCCE